MPTKYLSFDFYRVILPNNAAFEDLLTAATQVTDLAARAKVSGPNAHTIRWEYLEFDAASGLWTGDITKIRHDIVPNKASLTTARQRLELTAEEATTEDTVWAYHAGTNTLVSHANRYGVSGYDIVAYFARLSTLNGVVDAAPIITSRGVEALAGMGQGTKMQFKVALPKRGPIPRSGEVSVDSAIEMAIQANAKYIEVELSVGHSSKRITMQKITELASALFRLTGKHRPVRKLVVTGNSDTGSCELDLLRDRLVSRQEVEITADRDLPYSSVRKNAACRAFAEKRAALTLDDADDGNADEDGDD